MDPAGRVARVPPQLGDQLRQAAADDVGVRASHELGERGVAAHDLIAVAGEADRVADEVERGGPLAGRGPDLSLGLPRAQQRAHGRDQLARIHRVGQVAVGAALESLGLVLGTGQAG